MNEYEHLRQRFDFELPDTYREMQEAGFFDFDNLNYLFLTDLEWLSLEQIITFKFLEFQIDGLIPFAKSARKDLFCWYPQWIFHDNTPVIFCPRDDNEAFGYAGDFAACIYRLLLEEFSGSCLVDSLGIEETSVRFRKYAQNIKGYLPPAWSNSLSLLAERPLKELEPDVFGVFSRSECNVLIERQLGFLHLNQKLIQYV